MICLLENTEFLLNKSLIFSCVYFQGQEIHIKLPTDISEQMKNQHDRTRFRDAISNLGFPSLDHPEVPDSNPFTPTESLIKTSTLNPTSFSADFEPNSKIMHPKQARNWEEELTTDFTTFRYEHHPHFLTYFICYVHMCPFTMSGIPLSCINDSLSIRSFPSLEYTLRKISIFCL